MLETGMEIIHKDGELVEKHKLFRVTSGKNSGLFYLLEDGTIVAAELNGEIISEKTFLPKKGGYHD